MGPGFRWIPQDSFNEAQIPVDSITDKPDSFNEHKAVIRTWSSALLRTCNCGNETPESAPRSLLGKELGGRGGVV